MLKSSISDLLDTIIHFPERLKAAWRLVNDPLRSKSYYPDEERKTKKQILYENILWVLKHREVNHYYFLWGLDRKNIDTSEYLGRKKSWHYLTTAMEETKVNGEKMNYHCLLHDKLVFNSYLYGLNFPTPKIIAFGDKNSIFSPETGRRVNVDALLGNNQDMFCKPNVGFGGHGAFQLKTDHNNFYINNNKVQKEDLIEKLSCNYIFQERIHQHDKINEIHPSSVNTIRAITIIKNGSPAILTPFLRIGSNNSYVDNWAGGGIIVPIEKDTGILHKYGWLQPGTGTLTTSHSNTKFTFEGFKIPFYKETVDLLLQLHSLFYGIHSIGWDVAITNDGPCIIESNDEWDLALQQAFDGGLKTYYTDSYKEYLKKNA